MRLIDADALITDIDAYWDWETVDGITATAVLKQTITDVRNAPTVDAVPVWRGKWKDYPIADGCIQCSACGVLRMGEPSNYCPNCGAKMEVEHDNS